MSARTTLATQTGIGAARRRLQGTGTAAWQIASVLAVMAAWEIAGRIPINYAFPPFLAILRAFFAMIFDGSLVWAFLVTLLPLVLGVLFSTIVGVGVGVLMGLRREIEWFAAPVFIVLQAAPVAAIIPLVTFVYGIGLAAKTVAVILLALPVIALNAYKAVRNVNPSLVTMCRSFLGTRRQVIAKVILPDASPVIFAGLRLGVGAGFVGVILAELLITPTGVGDLITYHRSVANYAEMYATILAIVVVSALCLNGLQRIETRLFRPERQGGV